MVCRFVVATRNTHDSDLLFLLVQVGFSVDMQVRKAAHRATLYALASTEACQFRCDEVVTLKVSINPIAGADHHRQQDFNVELALQPHYALAS